MPEFLVDKMFVVLCGKGFPTDTSSRHFKGNKLRSSSSRHLSLLAWSGIYTVFDLDDQHRCSIHRWCFVHKQPKVWELPGSDVSYWTWDKRHYRYIDDALSINNPKFENYLDQTYPIELKIKDTTESNISVSYLDLLRSIWRYGQCHTFNTDNRDDFYYFTLL